MRCVPACNVADVAASARSRGMTLSHLVERTMQGAGYHSVERLYVGSTFCEQYFLRQPERLWRESFALCRREGISATLVLPVFSQKDLTAGKDRIVALLRRYGGDIDEITANDPGMVEFSFSHLDRPLNAGRLLMKGARDPRPAHLAETRCDVGVPTIVTELFKHQKLGGIELDPTHAELDLSELSGLAPHLSVGVHTPYCVLSTGAICELAGARHPASERFRPNATCKLECSRCSITYELACDVRLLKFGRTVYFPNRGCIVREGDVVRMIVTPFDALVSASGDNGVDAGQAPLPEGGESAFAAGKRQGSGQLGPSHEKEV